MKQTFIFMMLLILSATSFSQQTNPAKPVTRADFLQKSKNQKTGAWVLLAGGTALMGTGLLIGNGKEASFGEAGTGVVLGGIGFLAAIGSIPLFIASGEKQTQGDALNFKK